LVGGRNESNMTQDEQMHISGDIKFASSGNIETQRAQETINVLQELMNKFGIVKINVAVNPWKKGPMKVKPKGPVISLN